jgi:hypothetical protein
MAALETCKPVLANRAGTILPGATGLLATALLLVAAEFLAGALVTKDFLLMAIVLSLISNFDFLTRPCKACRMPKCSKRLKKPVSHLFCGPILRVRLFSPRVRSGAMG